MSIISSYNEFKLTNITIPDYNKVTEKSVIAIPDFEINFREINASPAAIMIQGFTNDSFLDDLRTNIRTNFSVSELEESIDRRYSISTAHTTVMRFQNKFRYKDDFVKIIEEYREFDFGTFKVKKWTWYAMIGT